MTRSEHELQNRRLIEGILANFLGASDSGPVDRYFRPDYIRTVPWRMTAAPGLEAFLAWVKGASPDYIHDLKGIMVDGDYISVHPHTIREPGTLDYSVIDIFRIEDGLIAEY